MGFFDIVTDIASLPLDFVQDQISINGAIDNDGNSHVMDRLRKVTSGNSGKTMISQSDAEELIRATVKPRTSPSVEIIKPKEINLRKLETKEERRKKREDEHLTKAPDYLGDIDLKVLNEYDKLDDFQAIRDHLNSNGRKIYTDNEYFYHFEYKGRFFGLGFQGSRFLLCEYHTNKFRRYIGETKIINFDSLK